MISGVSPWFARRAAERRAAGDVKEAARICTEGLQRHPWYATGMLILGGCYEELGRTAEAVLQFRKALAVHPEAGIFQEALRRAERREREEFEMFAEQQSQAAGNSVGTLTFEQYVGGKASEGESTVDFLRQQAARREEDVDQERSPQEAPPAVRIVTETLAEIYASQGEYREAIGAFKALIERRPDESGRFLERIHELEILAAEKPLE